MSLKKYFVTSDVHSFYTLLINNLINKGFEINNQNHFLILCGDLFDRGTESFEIYDFVKSLGDRFIYIRGNHEDLLSDCVAEMENAERISSHHRGNKTIDTVDQFLFHFYGSDYGALVVEAVTAYRKSNFEDKTKLQELYKPIHNILDWINQKSVNYFELGDYIFVHGWIPKTPNDNIMYRWNGPKGEGGRHNPDWRNASEFDWRDARWFNGMEECKYYNVHEVGKTIVCGHWNCSWGHSYIEQKTKEFPPKNRDGWENAFEPYYGDGIIAIDACTSYSNLMNILVFEEVDENSVKLIQN